VPNLPTPPVQPIIAATQWEPGMFDFYRGMSWFLKVHRYDNQKQLIADLGPPNTPRDASRRAVSDRKPAR
jgi:hypothetical protein